MADNALLAALNDSLYTGADTYSGIGANAIAQSIPAMVNPFGSTSTNAGYVLGGSILSALLARMAKNDAADLNSEIMSKQAKFIGATPAQQLAMAEQDPRTFAKLQTALGANTLQQKAIDLATQRQLEITDPFKISAEQRAMQNQIDLTTNPEIRAANIADSINKKRGDRIADLEADNIIFGNDPLKNPNSPEYKISQEVKKEEDAARAELSKIPSVVSFNNASNALAKIKTLKDLDTATSDVPYIYAFVQGMDGGVVKEGEVALVQSSNPVLQKYTAQLNKALNGESSLTPEIKRQMYKELVDSQASVYNQALYDSKNRLDIVGQRGGDPLKATAIPTDLFLNNNETRPTVPPGMKLQRNKITGETRIVPQ